MRTSSAVYLTALVVVLWRAVLCCVCAGWAWCGQSSRQGLASGHPWAGASGECQTHEFIAQLHITHLTSHPVSPVCTCHVQPSCQEAPYQQPLALLSAICRRGAWQCNGQASASAVCALSKQLLPRFQRLQCHRWSLSPTCHQ